MHKSSKLAIVAVLAMITGFALTACGSTSPTTVSTITVAGTAPGVGATAQFSALAVMSDGSTQDVTSTATWSSSNAGLATVSTSGLVTGVAAGAVTIQASYAAVIGTDAITVAP